MSHSEILYKVKNIISPVFDNPEVILFGSRARGNHRQDSDFDILILLNTEIDFKDKSVILDLIYEIELENQVIITPLVHSRQEWQLRKVTPLYQIIEKEGIAA